MAISGMRGIGMFDPPSSTKAVVLAGPAASDKGAAKAQQKVELQDPYRQFIQDASKLYVDALKHNTTQIAKLIAVCASRRNTPAYVGLGSIAPDRHDRDARPTVATKRSDSGVTMM